VTVHGCTVRSPAKLHQNHATGSRDIHKSKPIPLLHLWASMACYRVNFTFTFIYIHSFNSYVALKWESKQFKVIFKMSRIQISARRSLFFMRVKVFFTPWGKCRELVLFEIVMWLIPSTTFPVHPLYRSLGVPQSTNIK